MISDIQRELGHGDGVDDGAGPARVCQHIEADSVQRAPEDHLPEIRAARLQGSE